MSKRKGWHHGRRPRRQATMSVMDLGPSAPFRLRSLTITDEARDRPPVPMGRRLGGPMLVPQKPFRTGNPDGPMSWHPSAQLALDQVEVLFQANSEIVEKAFRVLALYIEQGIGKDIDSLDVIIPYSKNPVTNLKVTWKKM